MPRSWPAAGSSVRWPNGRRRSRRSSPGIHRTGGRRDLVSAVDWLVIVQTIYGQRSNIPVRRVRVVFSLAPENEAFRTNRRHLFLMTSGLTIVAAMLLTLLARLYVVRPLHRLEAAAGAVAAGDLSVRVEVNTGDEVASLARSFNAMGEAVALRQSQVESHNRDMRLVLDHVDQGLFTIDRNGIVMPEHSLALRSWLGAPAPNDTLWAYFGKFDPALAVQLRMGWDDILEDNSAAHRARGSTRCRSR